MTSTFSPDLNSYPLFSLPGLTREHYCAKVPPVILSLGRSASRYRTAVFRRVSRTVWSPWRETGHVSNANSLTIRESVLVVTQVLGDHGSSKFKEESQAILRQLFPYSFKQGTKKQLIHHLRKLRSPCFPHRTVFLP